MNQKQIGVCIQRHFELEMKLLDELESLCGQFGQIVETIPTEPVDDLGLNQSDTRLSALAQTAENVTASRQKILSLINPVKDSLELTMTIRQFIEGLPERLRLPLSTTRKRLIDRMRELKARFAADSAVAFYSFDFYRRIINGLVNCIEEEKHYTAAGKTSSQQSGQLLKRAC